MSRPSAREEMAQIALRLAVEHGTNALTFESVAEAAGKTKGGVLYHFPTKDDLVEAVCAQLVGEWEANALQRLGKPFDEATREERMTAFILASTEPGTASTPVSDLLVAIDVARDGHYAELWRALRDRWVGDASELSVTQQVALLAADGMWVDASLQQEPFPPERREDILARLAEMIVEG